MAATAFTVAKGKHTMELPERKIWLEMKRRCHSAKSCDYRLYGARGILVCDRWMSFGNFIADMGARPTPKHMLERIDNDGSYSPENCRWATAIEQARNRRSNHLVRVGRKMVTLAEAQEITGIQDSTIRQRINLGWDEERAATTPVRREKITVNGERISVHEAARRFGLHPNTLLNRIAKGCSLDEALTRAPCKGSRLQKENFRCL